MTDRLRFFGYLLLFILLAGLLGVWQETSFNERASQADVVNFETCAQAGYPLTLSYPRQCRGPNNRAFTEGALPITTASSTGTAAAPIDRRICA